MAGGRHHVTRSGRGLTLQVFPPAVGTGNGLALGGCFDLDTLQIEFTPAVAADKGMGRSPAPVVADDVGITWLRGTHGGSFRWGNAFGPGLGITGLNTG